MIKSSDQLKCGEVKEVLNVSDIIGDWGKWQRNLSFLVFFQGIAMAFCTMGFSFHAFKVEFWCHDVPIHYQNKTEQMKCYSFLNQSEKCLKWRYDRSLMEETLTSEFDLVCDRSYLASLTQSVYMIGYMVAGTLGSHLSDRYGRIPVSVIASILEMASTISSAISFNITQYLISRFILAVSTTTRRYTLWTLLFECIGTRYRSDIVPLVGLGWVVGYTLVPLIAIWLRNFRYMLAANTLPYLLIIIWFYFQDESPRWQIIKGRYAEAENTIRKALVMNGKSVDGLSGKMNQLKEHIESQTKQEEIGTKNHQSNLFDLFKTPNLRKNTLICCFSIIVTILIYYGISYNIGDFGGNYYINFALGGLVEAPSQILCIYGFRFMGRKTLAFIFLIVSALSSAIMIIPIASLRIAFALVSKCCVSAMWWVIFIVCAEIYPTELRSTGSGIVQVMGRIGAIIAPFIKDIGELTSHTFIMSLYSILCLIACILIIFLPETKGLNVPDTLMEAENIGCKDKVNR